MEDSKSCRILVVEGDPAQQALYCHGLAEFALALVPTAQEGERAIRKSLERGEPFVGMYVRDLNFAATAWQIDPNIFLMLVTEGADACLEQMQRSFGDESVRPWSFLKTPLTAKQIEIKATRMFNRWRVQQQMMVLDRQAALGRAARSIGHELGNIWQPVLTGLEVAAKELRHPIIRAAMEAATLGASISQDLLHLGADRTDVGVVVPSNILKTVKKSLRLVSHDLKSKDIQVRSSLSPGVEARIPEGKFLQILINLLMNAIEAMNDGGVLMISIQEAEKWIQLTITDDGCGLEPSLLKHAFKSSFTTKGSEGNGLGLLICRSIAESFAGNIRLESTPEGTSVTLILPRQVSELKSIA